MFVWIGFITYNSLVVVQVIDGTPGDARFFVALGNLAYAVAANPAGRITAMVNSHIFSSWSPTSVSWSNSQYFSLYLARRSQRSASGATERA